MLFKTMNIMQVSKTFQDRCIENFKYLKRENILRELNGNSKNWIADIIFKYNELGFLTVTSQPGASHEAIISYMRSQPPGELDVATIKRDLDLADSVWKESVAPALRHPEHALTRSLAELGTTYVVRGKGRGAQSLLVKV